MKAAQLEEFRKPMSIVDIAVPEVGPTSALVKVSASGVCRTDWHTWNGDFGWVGFQPPLPIVLGHEIGGEVVEIGAGVNRLKVGARVTVPFIEACGHCEPCRAGVSQLCGNLNSPGLTHSGGYAEFVSIPNADLNCIPVPDGVDALAAASLGCRYSAAFNAVVEVGAIRPGDWVTVFGAGGTGHAAVQIAAAVGGYPIAIDVRDEALALATRAGAVTTLNSSTTDDVPAAVKEITGGGADLSIDCFAQAGTPVQSLLGLRSGGQHVQLGFTSQADQGIAALPIDLITMLGLRFTGCMCAPHSRYPDLLRMVARGTLNPSALIEKQIHLNQINDTLAALDNFQTLGMHVITTFDSD